MLWQSIHGTEHCRHTFCTAHMRIDDYHLRCRWCATMNCMNISSSGFDDFRRCADWRGEYECVCGQNASSARRRENPVLGCWLHIFDKGAEPVQSQVKPSSPDSIGHSSSLLQTISHGTRLPWNVVGIVRAAIRPDLLLFTLPRKSVELSLRVHVPVGASVRKPCAMVFLCRRVYAS